MQFGVVFPQTEFGNFPEAVHDYAQIVEELGYTHVLAYDHVLGANPERPGGWQGFYSHKDSFFEPFVLFSYIAPIAQKMELVTGVIILPQRQTALVAKQAATLDALSGGRLRLGIGIGWNQVEYTSLDENFHNRGKRIEEQVQLLRLLWQQPLVNYQGKYHHIPDAGLNPLPTRRNIPIWFGGHAEPMLRRAARLGDGWMPNYRTIEQARPSLELFDRLLEEAGRNRGDFGLHPRLSYGKGDVSEWESILKGWQEAGATHLSVNTMGSGFTTPGEHLAALQRMAEVLGING